MHKSAPLVWKSSRPTGTTRTPTAFEQLSDRGTPLGIAQGAHHAARLVQHDVHERLGHQPIAVDLDLGLARVDPNAELVDHAAVDLHPTLGDQFLGGSPRGDTSARQDFLKPFFCHKGGRS